MKCAPNNALAIKIIFIFGLLFLFSGCAKGQTEFLGRSVTHTPKPLIIIAGESNAGGFAVNSDCTTYELAPRASLKILNNTNLKFENLDIGTNNLLGHQNLPDNATHGFENGLANSADSGSLGNAPVYIMKAGSGGARIAWWNDSTIIYLGANAWQQFKIRADTAISLLTAINGSIPPQIYLLWTQGINDFNATTDSTSWKDSTKSFFTKFRLRYGSAVPIFMTYLPPGRTTYNPKITEIASEVTNCYAIITSDATLRDASHWDYAGCKLIAARMVAILKAHYKNLN